MKQKQCVVLVSEESRDFEDVLNIPASNWKAKAQQNLENVITFMFATK
jgi:hypothetical protein